MSKTYIPKALRARVAEQSRHRCGYCLTPEFIVGYELDIGHLIPEALGGQTVEENLWLACNRCNEHKGDRIQATDPQTGAGVPLFNPRAQLWSAHFAWNDAGDQIIGRTPIGRATVEALQLNRELFGEVAAGLGRSGSTSSQRVIIKMAVRRGGHGLFSAREY